MLVTNDAVKVYPETDMPETMNTLICPFCRNRSAITHPGKTKCPECGSQFEIDDRLECVFVDPDNIRLPISGVVCPSCGLVQGDENKACLNCGIELNTAVHRYLNNGKEYRQIRPVGPAISKPQAAVPPN